MSKKSSVFITGATRGIGLAIAHRFDQAGWKLMLHGSSENSVAQLRDIFPQALILSADLSNPLQIQDLCMQLKTMDCPDILVNNAGLFLPGSIHEEAEGTFETLMSVNLSAPYHISRALLPGFMERKSGVILNMCSTASITGYTNGGSYCISKFGLLGMSKVLREELKPYSVKVISILPGATYTDSWAGSGLPESRFISVEDLAELVFTACTLQSSAVAEEIIIRPLAGDIGN